MTNVPAIKFEKNGRNLGQKVKQGVKQNLVDFRKEANRKVNRLSDTAGLGSKNRKNLKRRMKTLIGVSEPQERVESELERLMADTCAVQMKTRNFLWNSENPDALLAVLESHRRELSRSLDDIAETIRNEGRQVPATFSEIEDLTSVCEHKSLPREGKVIHALKRAHEKVQNTAISAMTSADRTNDMAAKRLARERLKRHQAMVDELSAIAA